MITKHPETPAFVVSDADFEGQIAEGPGRLGRVSGQSAH
jgi:hypothetical protein